MDFTNYINAELLVLVPVLYALGAVIKNTNLINDKYIPAILTLLGVAFCLLYVLGTQGVNYTSIFTALVQGVLVAATAVYSNQLIKQANN